MLHALSPYSGEMGILGDEEIREFMPAVVKLQEEGVKITRPPPAGTLFIPVALPYRVLNVRLSHYELPRPETYSYKNARYEQLRKYYDRSRCDKDISIARHRL